MSNLPIYLHILLAFLSTVGFSIYLNAPKNQLIPCGITGTIGWIAYYFIEKVTGNPIFANFIAALMVALCGEKLARILKKPAILYIIPGILPLVPGAGLYKTMLSLVQGNYIEALTKGTDTLLIGGAIALAMLVTNSIVRSIYFIKKNK